MRRPCTGRQCDVSLGMWGNDGRPAHKRLRAQAPSPSFTEETYAVFELFDLSKRSMECVCDVRCAASQLMSGGAMRMNSRRTCCRVQPGGMQPELAEERHNLAGQSRVTSMATIETPVRSSFGE